MEIGQLRDKRVAVLCGGQSGEREVSLRSGQGVLEALRRQAFDAIMIDPGPDLVTQLRQAGVQVVFNALHGGAGEDGTISAVLDYAGIPYTGSGMVASALAMNKLCTKRLLRDAGLPTPDFVHLCRGDDLSDRATEVVSLLGLPAVTKPVSQGSSLGVSIPKNRTELRQALEELLEQYHEALAEKFIDGTEITVGIIGVGPRLRALPVLEVIPHKEFYDYEAKYTKGLTDLIAPARISAQHTEQAQTVAVAAHKLLGLCGISRADMHLDSQGKVWIHELNSIPGLTELSDVPAQARAGGMTYDQLILEILTSAIPRM